MNHRFLIIILIMNILPINSAWCKEPKSPVASDMQNTEGRLKYLPNHDMEINMAIKYNPAFREIEADDSAAKMRVRLGKAYGGEYNISIRMINKSEYGKIKEIKSNKDRFYYEYSGLGITLIMKKIEETKYRISGSVRIGSRIKKIQEFFLIERIKGNEIIYEAQEPEMMISSDRYSIVGSINTKQFNKRAFVGVVSFILVLRYKNAGTRLPQAVQEVQVQPEKNR